MTFPPHKRQHCLLGTQPLFKRTSLKIRLLSDTATSNTITVTSTDTNTEVTDVDLELGGTLPPPQIIIQPPPAPRFTGGGNTGDPLAQTFTVDDETGIFVTKVDFYFRTKAESAPVMFHIRETKLGQPTVKLFHSLKFHLILIRSTSVMMVQLQTTFTFQSPVYLEGETEYAMVLMSHATDYTVYISRLGEADITTLGGGESDQVIVSEQPLLGSLFKSQNASIWTPSQYEDLKFKLYRANFKSTGSVSFFNPLLPESLEKVDPNGLSLESRQVRVGLGTTVNDASVPEPLQLGNTVKQLSIGAQGTLVAFGWISNR